MNPADFFKLTMSVDEAEQQFNQLPADDRARCIPDNFATRILLSNLTPAQAQAALVLAWNVVLDKTRFKFPDG